MFAKGSQLAQVRPSASASTAFTSTLRTEVTRIVVCNTTGGAVTYSIYHDDDGTTYDQSTSRSYETSIAANTTVTYVADAAGAGFAMQRGASIGVKPSADLAITFTFYGVTEDVADRR